MLAVRGKPLALHLGDCSAVVTAWLLAVALPSLAPWWLTPWALPSPSWSPSILYGGWATTRSIRR
jgi:electron transport complex protein RnfD